MKPKPIKTKFTEQVGIDYPIICGAMYPCSSPGLVASVSEAGGIGIVQPMSFVYVRKLDFRSALKSIRQVTSKPYGLNIILVPGYEDRLRTWAEIALEEGCRFFVTALGKPNWVVDMAHRAGGIVYHDVIMKEHALKGIDAGVDGFICVNKRAGGHMGYKSDQELHNELKELNKPLICAGGIGDENDFVKALQMGYDGVQMATRFIASFECDETDQYKQAILDAKEDDIVSSNLGDGVPSAIIKTPEIEKRGVNAGPFLSWLLRNRYTKKMARAWLSRRTFTNTRKGKTTRFFQAGKSVGHIHKIEHVNDIITRFVDSLRRASSKSPA
jgi:nitronate monooxygenase